MLLNLKSISFFPGIIFKYNFMDVLRRIRNRDDLLFIGKIQFSGDDVGIEYANCRSFELLGLNYLLYVVNDAGKIFVPG